MALGDRKSADIFNKRTGDNADAKSITSAKELEIKADFEAGVHISDEGMFNNMAPALYAVQQVAEDIEELRRFVGAEVDATPSWVASSDPNYATQAYVQTQVSGLVDSAPSTLNTLNELAAALGDDANFSTTVTNNIATKLAKTGGTMTGSLVLDDNSGDSPSIQFKNESDINYQLYTGSSSLILTRVNNGGADFSFSGSSTNYTNSTLSVGGAVISSTKIGNWDTAYGWGNHASAGYLTSSSTQSKYLRSDADDSWTGKLTWAGTDYADGINMSLGNINDAHYVDANEYRQRHSGRFRNNLGDPTITEMALFEAQFGPKTTLANDYDDLTDLTFWSQETSSSDWVEVTSYSDDQKRKFLRTNNSTVVIPNTYYKFRVEFKAKSYTFANAVYMYWSSQSHNSQVHVWKKRCSDGTWLQHTSATNTISSWPGHGWVPFSNIPWHETNTTSTGHFTHIRVEFTPNWSGHATYGDRPIAIYGMQIWGGYPRGRRTPHYYDQNGEFNFLKDAHILDNNTLYIGTGGDLQLYHDGSNSYIDEAGTGNLVVRANSQLVAQKYTGETMFKGIADGAFEAYHNNVKKLETTSNGATVTGKLSTTAGLQVSGTGWQSYGLTVSSTTASGAVIHLNNTERAFQIASRGNSLDFRDITAGDTRRFYIDSTGKAFFEGDVAIGPKSNATVSVSESGGADVKMRAGSVGRIGTYSNHNLVITQNGSDALTIDTSRDATFVGSVTATTLFGNHPDGNGSSLKLGRADNSNYWFFNHAGNDLRIYNTASSGSDILLGVDPSGSAEANNVGIGTATPGEKLEVAGNVKLSGNLNVGGYIHPNDENGNLSIYGGNNTTNDAHILLHGDSNYWGSLELNYGYDATNSFLKISQGSNEHLRITNGGKVGIGTTSPSEKLDVVGNIAVSGTVDGVDIATQANAVTANTAKRDARYIYVPVVCNFYGDLSTGEYHVPFSDGETESTSTTNRRNQFVAPCDGHFHKVIIRSNNSTLERGVAKDLTIKSKKVASGTASVTTLETKVVDTVAAETKMVATFDSTNSAFDEGDRLLLSMALTEGLPRGSKSYFVTVVFKIDQSDLD